MKKEHLDYSNYPSVAKFYSENAESKSLMESTLNWLLSFYTGDFARYQNKTDKNTCVYYFFNHINEGLVRVIGRKGHVNICFTILKSMKLTGNKEAELFKGRRIHPEGEVTVNKRVIFTIKTPSDLKDVEKFLGENQYWNFDISRTGEAEDNSIKIIPNSVIKTSVEIKRCYELNPRNGYGFIYAIKNKINPKIIKIGMTTISVQKRMNEIKLNGAYPYDFQCVAFVEVDAAYHSEQKIHKELEAHRIANSEWFSITNEKAIEALTSHANKIKS